MRRLFLVFLAVVRGASAATPANPLAVELVCESDSIQPGKPFFAGLLLQHPDSYHSYWRFPGIVGVPTSLKWDLPKGWTAGPLQWPTPERVRMFKIKAQGFHGRKLIPVEITPPKTLATGSRIHLTATASWMCCGKDCNPGYKKLDLEVISSPSTPTPNRAYTHDFSAARASLPAALPGWKVTARKEDTRIVVHAAAASPGAQEMLKHLRSATFFTQDGLTDPNREEVFRRQPDGFLLEIGLSEFAPRPLPDELRGILVTPEGWLPGHPDQGLQISVPLR